MMTSLGFPAFAFATVAAMVIVLPGLLALMLLAAARTRMVSARAGVRRR